MKVAELQQQELLLAGSNETEASRDDYGTANSDVDESELTDGVWNWD